MPMFHPTRHNGGSAGDDAADGAVLYQPPRGARARAEKRIRRDGKRQVASLGLRHELAGRVDRHGQRLF